MARAFDFDELVERLLDNVALSGKKGIGFNEVDQAVKAFVASRHDDEPARPDESVDLLFSDAPPQSSTESDEAVIDAVWAWMSKRPDVQIKSFDEGGIEVVADAAPLPRPSQRIFASEERVWQAMTGHGVDHARVPPKVFECLEVIAAHGPTGILQPELRRITGQDKRSVPQRTNLLFDRGYIVKDTVLGGGSKTSLLKLRKFANESQPSSSTGARAYPQQHKSDVDHGNIVFYERWYDQVIDMLKANGNIIVFADLRLGLGVDQDRWGARALSRCIKRLVENGLIRKLKARIKEESEAEKNGGLPFADWVRSLQLLREPTEFDRIAFKRSLRESEKNQETALKEQPEAIDFEASTYLDNADDDETEATFQNRTRPSWTPDVLYLNQVFNIIDSAGPTGITSIELVTRSMGTMWKRPLEEILMRLTDTWKISQPSHLRHLGIIRDIAVVGKQSNYIYRSFGNFQKAVDMGQARWDAVDVTMGEKRRSGHALPKKKIKPPPVVDMDEYGFPRLDPSLFAGKDGRASLAGAEMLARKQHFRKSGRAAGWRLNRTMLQVEKDSSEVPIPLEERSYDNLHEKVRVATEAGRKEYEDAVPERAQRLLRAELKKRTSDEAQLRESGRPTKASRSAGPASDAPRENLPERRLQQIEADLLAREKPGVYINPPGAKMEKQGYRVVQGRPRKTTIAVFKSPRLAGLPCFGGNTENAQRFSFKGYKNNLKADRDGFHPIGHARFQPRDQSLHGTALDLSTPRAIALSTATTPAQTPTAPLEKTKRKRGRPPKSDDDTPKIPKKRGRPTKLMVLERERLRREAEEAATAAREDHLTRDVSGTERLDQVSQDSALRMPTIGSFKPDGTRKTPLPPAHVRAPANDPAQDHTPVSTENEAPKDLLQAVASSPPPASHSPITAALRVDGDDFRVHSPAVAVLTRDVMRSLEEEPALSSQETPATPGDSRESPQPSMEDPLAVPSASQMDSATTDASPSSGSQLELSKRVRDHDQRLTGFRAQARQGEAKAKSVTPTSALSPALHSAGSNNLEEKAGSASNKHDTVISAGQDNGRPAVREPDATSTLNIIRPSNNEDAVSNEATATPACPPIETHFDSDNQRIDSAPAATLQPRVMSVIQTGDATHESQSRTSTPSNTPDVEAVGTETVQNETPENESSAKVAPESSNDEDFSSLSPLLAVDAAQYSVSSKSRRLGKMVVHQRQDVILEILRQAGDVFPGDNELWHQFQSAWYKIHGTRPDAKTVRTALEGLLGDNKVKKYSFKFQDQRSNIVIRHILMEATIDPASQPAKKVQKAMIDAYPRRYNPINIEIDQESRERATGTTPSKRKSATTKNGEAARASQTDSASEPAKAEERKMHKPSEKGPIEFPFIEGVTVSRTPAAQALNRAFDDTLKNFKANFKGNLHSKRKREQGHLRSSLTTSQPQEEITIEVSDDESDDYSDSIDGESVELPERQQIESLAGYNRRLAAYKSGKAISLPRKLLKMGGSSIARYHHPAQLSKRRSVNSQTLAIGSPTNERVRFGRDVPIKPQVAEVLPPVGLLMHPEQFFIPSNGTFGTDPIAHHLHESIHLGRRGRISRAAVNSLSLAPPKDLANILQKASTVGFHSADPADSRLFQFEQELACVEMWERVLAKIGQSAIPAEPWTFVSHVLNRKHIQSRPETWQVDFLEPNTSPIASQASRAQVPTQTVDRATIYADPNGFSWAQRASSSGRFPTGPGKQSYKPLAAFGTSLQNSAPLNFVRSTVGKPLPAILPRAFPVNAPAKPTAQEKGGPLSNRAAAHKPKPAYQYTSQKEKPALSSVQGDEATDDNVKPKKRKYVRSGKYSRAAMEEAALRGTRSAASVKQPAPQHSTFSAGNFSKKAISKIEFTDYDRLPLAVALVRSLCGGISEHNNWDVIAHAMGFKYEPRQLMDQWRGLAKQGGGLFARKVQRALHEPFLLAYQERRLPAIDFNDLSRTDWPALLRWVESEVSPLVEDHEIKQELPESRKKLEETYEVAHLGDVAPNNDDKLFLSATEYGSRHVDSRAEASVKRTFGIPLPGMPLPENPAHTYDLDESLILVKSWARAICTTREADYSAQTAAGKLRVFGDAVVQRAIDQMVETNTFIQLKKDRQLPGRNYRLSRYCLEQFKRWPGQDQEFLFLREVATARTSIMQHFATNSEFELKSATTENHVVVLTNMIAQGHLKPLTILPPRNDDLDAPCPKLSLWGYSGYRYQSKAIGKSAFHFPIIYQKTAKFTPEHNLVPAVPLPDRPVFVANEPHPRLPLWLDINGNLLAPIWDMVMRSVLHCVAFRAGLTSKMIEKAHRNKLWVWEIELVLAWMEATRLVVKSRVMSAKKGGQVEEGENGRDRGSEGAWYGGWRAGEWWYCAYLPEISTWKAPE